MVKVPKRFTLLGVQYTVEVIPPTKWRHPECVGYFDQNRGVVQIKKAAPDITLQTYFHELVHLILTSANREDLSGDEGLVDLMASLIHQALATSEYGKPGA